MKKEKDFDCVQMKWDIQQTIQKEYESVSDIQAHNQQLSKALENPILGPLIKKVRRQTVIL